MPVAARLGQLGPLRQPLAHMEAECGRIPRCSLPSAGANLATWTSVRMSQAVDQTTARLPGAWVAERTSGLDAAKLFELSG